eukprot:scaffold14582_cov108-Isochrysis_galbana.AAC.11
MYPPRHVLLVAVACVLKQHKAARRLAQLIGLRLPNRLRHARRKGEERLLSAGPAGRPHHAHRVRGLLARVWVLHSVLKLVQWLPSPVRGSLGSRQQRRLTHALLGNGLAQQPRRRLTRWAQRPAQAEAGHERADDHRQVLLASPARGTKGYVRSRRAAGGRAGAGSGREGWVHHALRVPGVGLPEIDGGVLGPGGDGVGVGGERGGHRSKPFATPPLPAYTTLHVASPAIVIVSQIDHPCLTRVAPAHTLKGIGTRSDLRRRRTA